MTNSKGKLRLIVLAFVVLALMSVACDDITPGDGQVADTVIEGQNVIRETAETVFEAVESTGEGLVITQTHGTVIIDTMWDIAKDIAEGE